MMNDFRIVCPNWWKTELDKPGFVRFAIHGLKNVKIKSYSAIIKMNIMKIFIPIENYDYFKLQWVAGL